MKSIFETKRTYLREFLPEDAVHFYNLNLDPEVVQFTGDAPFLSIAEAEKFIHDYTAYNDYGIGRWAVIRKKDGVFLGFCGLKFHAEEKIVEIGFRFFKKYWNLGYATETASATLDYGFKTLGYQGIYAHAAKSNLASQRVLEKIGLRQLKEIIYDTVPAYLYKKNNPHLEIKTINAKETYVVRHPVLRAGRPIEDCAFDADNLSTTFHLGLFLNKKIVGVATFIQNEQASIQGNNLYQLRGMAVLPKFHQRGYGGLLLLKGEDILKKKKCDSLWFNARAVAILFYKKHNYSIVGDSFKIPKVGLHYLMTKKL